MADSSLKARKLFLVVVVGVLFCSGMTALIVACLKRPPVVEEEKPRPGIVQFRPGRLFTGEMRRVEPHFAMSSGCVTYASTERRLYIQMKQLVFERGKPVAESGISSGLASGTGELSFSIKEASPDADGVRRYQLIQAFVSRNECHMSSRIGLKMPEQPSGIISYSTPTASPCDLVEHEWTAVWGYLINDGDSHGEEDIEAAAARAYWAVVVKVAWSNRGLGD